MIQAGSPNNVPTDNSATKSPAIRLESVEDTAAASASNDPPQTVIEIGWDTFEKVHMIGEGANGTVYKVKALKSSIFSEEKKARIELDTPELIHKYASSKQKLGINMTSGLERKNKTRLLLADQVYVIKEINVSMLPEQAAFEAMQEIQIMAEVDSHFMVGYYDSFITDQTICIVMEYCQHGDLCEAIKNKKGKPFPNNFLWKVFIHICLGMHYLHNRNVIHRDIKSLNVFLTKDNSAKLGDFGNIKRVKDESVSNESPGGPANAGGGNLLQAIGEVSEVTESEAGHETEEDEVQRVGTPYYLAPELWHDKRQTKASDIWALGVVLYEMCAHKYPYDANDIDELKEKVCNQRYNPIPQGVTKDFNMIIKQCLQRKPENRATIDEIIFSEDFQNKAKVNKITLPKHLNKQKILQSLSTKKLLDQDELKLILSLIKRGFLPKHLENDPVIINSQSWGEPHASVQKQRSLEVAEGLAEDIISNPSPEMSRLHATKSHGDGKSSAFLRGTGSS